MAQIQPKQIQMLLMAQLHVSHVGYPSIASGAADLTPVLSSVCQSAGAGERPVPFVVSANTLSAGFVVNNAAIVQVWEAATGSKLSDEEGNEVYARVSPYGGSWFVSLHTMQDGTETHYQLPAATDLNFAFAYRYPLHLLPPDAFMGIEARYISSDPKGAAVVHTERLVVTGFNVVTPMSRAPSVGKVITVTVNGLPHSSMSQLPSFTVDGNTIVWQPQNAGYVLEPSDEVIISYSI